MSLTGQPSARTSDSSPAGRVQGGNAARPGTPNRGGQAKMPPRRTWMWFVIIMLVNFVLARVLLPSAEGPVTVPYTLFKEQVTKGNVQAIYSRGDMITGRFKTPVTYAPASVKPVGRSGQQQAPGERRAAPGSAPKTVSSFTTTLPSFVDPGLEAFLIGHGVEISAKPIEEGGSPWSTLIFGFGPTLLFIGFYVWMFR
jgi:cell division protease FtsH